MTRDAGRWASALELSELEVSLADEYGALEVDEDRAWVSREWLDRLRRLQSPTHADTQPPGNDEPESTRQLATWERGLDCRFADMRAALRAEQDAFEERIAERVGEILRAVNVVRDEALANAEAIRRADAAKAAAEAVRRHCDSMRCPYRSETPPPTSQG